MTLVICASAVCVWDDLSKVPKLDPTKWSQAFDIMAVNDVGMHIPYKLSHWYSNDSWLKFWKDARRPWFHTQDGPRGGRRESIKYHCWQPIQGFSDLNVWDLQGGGTSTLNAALCAKKYLGYENIYICGAPLDNGPHYFDPPWIEENFDNTHELGIWRSMKPELSGVISMSGNTKLILEE